MPLDTARRRIFELASRRVFYGWAMVAVAALGLFASGPGQSHTFGGETADAQVLKVRGHARRDDLG